MGSKLTFMTRRRMYNHFRQQLPFEGTLFVTNLAKMTSEVAGMAWHGILQIMTSTAFARSKHLPVVKEKPLQ
jgi:hypothetical protein